MDNIEHYTRAEENTITTDANAGNIFNDSGFNKFMNRDYEAERNKIVEAYMNEEKPKGSRGRSQNHKRHGKISYVKFDDSIIDDSKYKFYNNYNTDLLKEDDYQFIKKNKADKSINELTKIYVLKNTFAIRTILDNAFVYVANIIVEHISSSQRVFCDKIFEHMFSLSDVINKIDKSNERRIELSSDDIIDSLYFAKQAIKNCIRLFFYLLKSHVITPIHYNTIVLLLSEIYTKISSYLNNILLHKMIRNN